MPLSYCVGEDSWESLDCKEIKPVNPKGNQSWIFIGGTDAETPILWTPYAMSWLVGKDPDAGKDWEQEEEMGATGDKMVGWHHWCSGQEQTLGNGEGQRNLACCTSWGRKESDKTATEPQQPSRPCRKLLPPAGSPSHQDQSLPHGSAEKWGHRPTRCSPCRWAREGLLPFNTKESLKGKRIREGRMWRKRKRTCSSLENAGKCTNPGRPGTRSDLSVRL